MYVVQNIADRIKQRSNVLNIKLKDMLVDLNMGINTISELRKGKELSCVRLAKIADYLNCSVDYLLGRTDNPEFHPQKLVPAHFEDVFLAAHGGDIHVPDTYETPPAARKLIDDILNREAENDN